MLEFLSMLPIAETENEVMERFMDKIDALAELQYSDHAKKQRPLASFDSYFLFNDIINDYWNQDLENDTRLFYYPALPLVADYGDYSIASKGIYPNSEKLLRREKRRKLYYLT